eukprot:CAMPEP_0182424318 /NCGR_PEP_ID=MMETSP1167-20130531/10517_1 /TAXON_ID=2988 /ORGANISM="Mallomonas Sp, Strain CCMP3275" /LENGTH=333 /DNA_ID=CAMNT_0024604043 /DNA_START=145 /DNA_END=1142 /DNA_ORIENTATION=+
MSAAPLPPPDSSGAETYLSSHDWPQGLQTQLIRGIYQTPIRFIIVDNSGSMITSDGRQFLTNGQNGRYVKCSRWTELTSTLRFHAALAESARAPTEFRLLNDAPPIILGMGDDNGQRHQFLLSLLDQSPSGRTPICKHIREIIGRITQLAPQLRANNQKAVLIIASDGEATDGNVALEMGPLKDLPVWVVIRLCTEEEEICDYWNNIDKELELDMDVLDDIVTEAEEVTKVNKWLTYGEPLHRLREFGILIKEMDMLDETALSPDQMRNVLAVILTGSPASEIPHPAVDWECFSLFVNNILDSAPKTWCPLSKSLQPWIKTIQLTKVFKHDRS